MFMQLFKTFLYLFVCFLISSCASAVVEKQPRIPETKNQSPQYQTDEALKKEIVRLEEQLGKNPGNSEIELKLSTLHYEVGNHEQAMKYMELLAGKNYNQEPRIYSALSELYKKDKAYAKSLSSLQTFKTLLRPDSKTHESVDRDIAELEFIIESVSNPFAINLRPLDKTINTHNSEYLAQFTIDEATLFFTRRYQDQEDLFQAKKTSEGYTVTPLETINTELNEGAHTTTADGSLIILTKCDPRFGYGSCDLYQSTLKANGEWSEPANLGAIINTRHWEAQPSLSANGRKLFFTSKRPGGLGGADLYYSVRQRDGSWGKPRNLGPKINTSQSEESPFIHPDGRTLYFRSKGYKGFGSFDIYTSRLKNKQWGTPIHLGYPINTSGEDGALVVNLNGDKGFYSSDVYNEEKLGHLDLFEFDLPEPFRPSPMTYIKGRIIDEQTNEPIKAEILITYLDSSNYKIVYKANYNGEFLAAVPVGQPTSITVGARDYVFYSDHINFDEVRYSSNPYSIDIGLAKVQDEVIKEEHKPTVLNNIFFASGSATLLSTSDNEISILYNLLKSQPSIKIEIIGHTDDIGDDNDNQVLSEQRAQAVKDAIVTKGITEARIQVAGKGESEPIASNEDEAGRAANRRTEFIILN